MALGTSLSGLVLVPILPAGTVAFNLVLSIYERSDGYDWLERELRIAAKDGKASFLERGFAATLPQPGSASEDAIPSSPGSIPVDGTTKPKREILHLRQKSSEE